MTAATTTNAIARQEDGIPLTATNMKSPPLSSRDEKLTTIIDQTAPRRTSAAPTSSTASSSSSDTGSLYTDDDDDVVDINASDCIECDADARQDNFRDHTLRQYFTKSHTRQMDKLAQDENRKLNLNLGLPLDLTIYTRRESGDNIMDVDAFSTTTSNTSFMTKILRPPIQVIIYLLDRILSYIESPLFQLWDNYIPLYIRQKITFLAWGIYLPLHKLFIGRRSGLHRDVSLEYHALTSVLWWGRLVSLVGVELFASVLPQTIYSRHFLNVCASFVVPRHYQTNAIFFESIACLAPP